MDRLDVLPFGPDPVRPDPFTETPKYEIRDGRLWGPGVYYCPTLTKRYERPVAFQGKPVAVVDHYTGIHASDRPIVHLKKLIRRASRRLDNSEGAIDALELQLIRLGHIPDAVSLTLQNAGKKRGASWCLCIGSVPLEDGTIPICQYSPDLNLFGTWHAGSPATWEMRKRFRGRVWRNSLGQTRWDGREYRWPVVDAGDGDSFVVVNPNPLTVGVETMSFGPMGLSRRLRYRDVPLVEVNGRFYEKPSEAQLRTRAGVFKAIARAFGPIPIWGHRDIVPWSKTDPTPPY